MKLAPPLARVKRAAERRQEDTDALHQAIRDAKKAGHSLRELEAVAGLSKMTVKRICD